MNFIKEYHDGTASKIPSVSIELGIVFSGIVLLILSIYLLNKYHRNVKSASESENEHAYYMLYRIYKNSLFGSKRKYALNCLHKAAELNDVNACLQLEKLYRLGKGVKKDLNKAHEYGEKARLLKSL